MCNLYNLTMMAAVVLLATVWTSGALAGLADTTARALVADWKDGDREMAAIAEVIASAFASGMSWAGTIEGHPLYCPPPIGAFSDTQAMNILGASLPIIPRPPTKPTALRSPPACGRRSPARLVEQKSHAPDGPEVEEASTIPLAGICQLPESHLSSPTNHC